MDAQILKFWSSNSHEWRIDFQAGGMMDPQIFQLEVYGTLKNKIYHKPCNSPIPR